MMSWRSLGLNSRPDDVLTKILPEAFPQRPPELTFQQLECFCFMLPGGSAELPVKLLHTRGVNSFGSSAALSTRSVVASSTCHDMPNRSTNGDSRRAVGQNKVRSGTGDGLVACAGKSGPMKLLARAYHVLQSDCHVLVIGRDQSGWMAASVRDKKQKN